MKPNILLITLLGLFILNCANDVASVSPNKNPVDNNPDLGGGDINSDPLLDPTDNPSDSSAGSKTYRSDFIFNKSTSTLNQSVEMDANFIGYFLSPGGKVMSGQNDIEAIDDYIIELMFPGNAAFGSSDHTGPGLYGTHIESDLAGTKFKYGTYRARFKTPTCLQPAPGVITGLFTYFNDGADYNQNGIIDNSEIDIEITCAEPANLYLTVWTDYADDESFHKKTRKIYLQTGKYDETKPGGEGSYGLGQKGTLPFSFPAIDSSKEYIEMEMIWDENYVEYFIIYQSQKYSLWKMSELASIPHNASYYMMNVWHNANHWHNDLPADYPGSDVTLKVDWFEYMPANLNE
ncbi:MAG: hypothetical protein ACD_73C00702G0002 [uncultured bacterium]|nr:MAG: hypothetical protein ACD_73C00702G0002 [uncultured bacterium]